MNIKKCIGILGGGQLARMSAYQAFKLGFDVAILEKEKNSPAGQLTKKEYVGWVDNESVLKEFSKHSDVVTLENEFIDSEKLHYIETLGKKVIPSSKTISLIQDKYIQKRTLERNGIPVPKFVKYDYENLYKDVTSKLGKKFVLKSRKMGYDGYGNALVENINSFNSGLKKLASRGSELYAEEFIDFAMELAIMIVRTKKEIKTYPVVQTIQENHICKTVIAPAQIPKKLAKFSEEIAISAVEAVSGYGIFGIEMFLTKDKNILVNEMAPRPHNSGHYTIEACVTSQFENHIRAVLGLPLGSTEMLRPFAVMINLLGKRNGDGIVRNYNKAFTDDNVHLHIYGKEKSRVGRKMGHITILGDNLYPILRRVKEIEKQIII
ncbi:MAG: 5-(carboxyamino)imidazole ribonucleotide synthase [Ignavibacteriaceae bacterium]